MRLYVVAIEDSESAFLTMTQAVSTWDEVIPAEALEDAEAERLVSEIASAER